MQAPALAAAQVLRDGGVNQQQLAAGSIYTLLHPGRSEQGVEMKGSSSQIPIITAQLAGTGGNPQSISHPLFVELRPKIQLYFDKYWHHDVMVLCICCPDIFQVEATLPTCLFFVFFLAYLGLSESSQFLLSVITNKGSTPSKAFTDQLSFRHVDDLGGFQTL